MSEVADLSRVQLEWGRRVEAEYHSAAITSELALWLIRIAASPDLIDDALRIVGDELVHARMSHEVFAAAGGSAVDAPMIDRDGLALERRGSEPLERDVVRTGVRVFCLGETVAVPLFAHLRRECTEAAPREALDRILADEVRHRDFGWDLLAWMLELPEAEAYRGLAETELPGYFAALEMAYGRRNPASADAPPTAIERRWGLAGASEYAELLERTIERDYVPRFAELGIDARAAWALRGG